MDRCWINQTLVHIVREWSESGIEERDQSFGLILEHLIKIYPDKSVRKDVQIFVPGSKLARLPFMIAAVSEANNSFYFHPPIHPCTHYFNKLILIFCRTLIVSVLIFSTPVLA
jgi:hypothetical protein